MQHESGRGFTLIELLIVIAIVAVLAVTVILTLNPAELLKQARDTTRISDLATLNTALATYVADVPTLAMGATSTVYVSLPDTSATCASWGLPSLPLNWTYACAPSSTLHNVNGSGWLPVDLTDVSAGSPLSQLPVDPVNAASQDAYYTYAVTSDGQFILTSALESEKLLRSSAAIDGGGDPLRYEVGSTSAFASLGSIAGSLIGYWGFEEGSGTVAGDQSGYGNTGVFAGAPVWQATTSCMVGSCLLFNAGSDSVVVDNVPVSVAAGEKATVAFWMRAASNARMPFGWNASYDLFLASASCFGVNTGSGEALGIAQNFATNTWVHVAIVFVNGVPNTSNIKIFINGEEQNIGYCSGSTSQSRTMTPRIFISGWGTSSAYRFSGRIDEVRIYGRELNEVEVNAIYEAQ